MAPKKLLSPSRSARRFFAVASSIRPAPRSASMASCLPGMLSKVKRAATSAIRPEPLVMTTKFTVTKIANTITPMTKLPLMTKPPKAWMTLPAAAVPSWPWPRIRRVDAMLSARRSMVDISSTVGNVENSSGFWMNSTTIRMSTDTVIDSASDISSRNAGIGSTSTVSTETTPKASAISPRSSEVVSRPDSPFRPPPMAKAL